MVSLVIRLTVAVKVTVRVLVGRLQFECRVRGSQGFYVPAVATTGTVTVVDTVTRTVTAAVPVAGVGAVVVGYGMTMAAYSQAASQGDRTAQTINCGMINVDVV